MATAVIARTLRALVALGAASWGCARPWEPVSLQGLTAGGSIEEARLTLELFAELDASTTEDLA